MDNLPISVVVLLLLWLHSCCCCYYYYLTSGAFTFDCNLSFLPSPSLLLVSEFEICCNICHLATAFREINTTAGKMCVVRGFLVSARLFGVTDLVL